MEDVGQDDFGQGRGLALIEKKQGAPMGGKITTFKNVSGVYKTQAQNRGIG